MALKNIVHITHTDINNDWRIRKEIYAVLNVLNDSHTLSVFSIDSGLDVNPFSKPNVKAFNFKPPAFCGGLPKFLRLPIILLLFSGYVLKNLNFKNVIVCHVHDTAVLHLGFFVKRFSSSLLIYDAHELESQKNMQSKIYSLVTLWLEKLFWPNIDVLISVSDGIIDWYNSAFSKKKSLLILNSPDRVDSEKADNIVDLRDIYCLGSEKLFVHIGLLQSGRGIERLLEVFSESEHRIVFLGFGVLDELIRSYSDRYDNIHLYKHVPNQILVPTISSADYGICTIENVSTSDYLALPNKYFEYLFAGLPVLVSNFPELEKYTLTYKVGFTTELDVNSIRDGVDKISKSDVNVNQSNIQELSWSAQSKKLGGLYIEILEDGFDDH